MRKLPARSVDHTITDPPYSEKTHAKGKRYKRGDIVDHVIGAQWKRVDPDPADPFAEQPRGNSRDDDLP